MNFVGIDLGTTNSVICSFDGETLHLWKSPEQNDVTPSAILIDRRGHTYVGKRAYDAAPQSQGAVAMNFKRFMGSATPIALPSVRRVFTPEQCSAEILKTMFGYLPEEIRNASSTGTVVTVPAAFNQMQKDATMQAAELAGLGQVALMQEPVAAIMSVMRARSTDGVFLVFDIGGGTLDVAIAESVSGRVSLLQLGGIEMCGGRDFDNLLAQHVVLPWARETFALPADFAVLPKYQPLVAMACWAAERGKIALSSREETVIGLSEAEVRVRDERGDEIYFDVPLSRQTLNSLITDKLDRAVEAANQALGRAGMTTGDVVRVVFVGGPTAYKPLRDYVCSALGVPGSSEGNPMTAVAEGAALFAESIDWASASRGRKTTRGALDAGGELRLSFNYPARTPASGTKVTVKTTTAVLPGTAFQIDSLDTGWSSGKVALRDGAAVEVTLTRSGDNRFKVFVFDAAGGPIRLEQNQLVITRTAATVDAIPASHSIGIEVLDKLGARPVLDWIVRAGDPLPAKGRRVFKTVESLRAGSSASLNFKLWEGEIETPVRDNRFIGVMRIEGSDFEANAISAGAELICEYEVNDAGHVRLEVSVPSIGGAFHSDHNFYSRNGVGLDYSDVSKLVADQGEETLTRINAIAEKVSDPALDKAREKVEAAIAVSAGAPAPESAKEAMDDVLDAKRTLADVRKAHLKEIRQVDLDSCVDFFESHIREYAKPSESAAFDSLAKTAQRAIDRDDHDFESLLSQLRGRNFEIMWRQDWFVVARFESMAESPWLFSDRQAYLRLLEVGNQARRADDIERLREVVLALYALKVSGGSEADMLTEANIVRS